MFDSTFTNCAKCNRPLSEKATTIYCSKRCKINAKFDVSRKILPSKNCPVCGDNFVPRTSNSKFCSPSCRTKYHTTIRIGPREINANSMVSGDLGAIGELLACVDLMALGWHVFRGVSPACPCDLIITKGDLVRRIEVRTGVRYLNGNVFYPSTVKDKGRSDHVAVILHAEKNIVYMPELPILGTH
jgi:endogenous inhibitor of DNA gyrase (YacG/DUF329 family)